MRWYASLLRSLVEHDKLPGLTHARQMSALEHTEWRRQKRTACSAAKSALIQGSRLSMQRDSNKRSYDDMSATEQQLLEDFDGRRLHKRVEATSIHIDKKPFRGSVRD